GFGGEDAFHSELSDAAATARDFATDHHEIVVEPNVSDLFLPLIRHLDEPVTDTSFVVTYLVSKLARQTLKVILSGVGGDEIFAGDVGNLLWTNDFAREVKDHRAERVADVYRSARCSDPLNRMLYADFKTSLVDSLLAFTDKMSMAVSLEARVPLLDYRLIELA